MWWEVESFFFIPGARLARKLNRGGRGGIGSAGGAGCWAVVVVVLLLLLLKGARLDGWFGLFVFFGRSKDDVCVWCCVCVIDGFNRRPYILSVITQYLYSISTVSLQHLYRIYICTSKQRHHTTSGRQHVQQKMI